MILGIGTDIVQVARIATSLSRSGDRLAARILTPDEMQRFVALSHSAAFLAKRFAAKEAAAKALGTGIAQGVSWQDIEVSNNELGAPQLQFHGRAREIQQAKGITRLDISLADEREYVVAFVTLSA